MMLPLSADQFMAQLPVPEVYRVGGSVRDELLGKQLKDRDYMVRGASLVELGDVLRKGGKIAPLKLRTGKQVGWRVTAKGIGHLEVVMPRKEISTGPGRHDFEIITMSTITLEEDALRRDFTINALYYDVRTEAIFDPLGRGLDDLRNREIATTHPTSFAEDPLRTLRALRFVSKLPNFDLARQTYFEMCEHAYAVTGLTDKGVSATALEELSGILMGNNAAYALRIARDTGVLAVLLPELAPMLGFEQRSRYHEKTTDEHTFDAIQAAAAMHSHAPLRVRLALLFHDSGKPNMAWIGKDGLQHYYALSPEQIEELDAPVMAEQSHEHWGAVNAGLALSRLGAPKQLHHDVTTLCARHMLPLHENIRPIKIRTLRSEIGDDMLRDLITHRVADVIGKGGDTSEAVEVLLWIANEQQRAIEQEVPLTVKELKITGQDLADIGLRGREIGEAQRKLLHEVLAQPKLNNHEWLQKQAEKYHKNQPRKVVGRATVGDVA